MFLSALDSVRQQQQQQQQQRKKIEGKEKEKTRPTSSGLRGLGSHLSAAAVKETVAEPPEKKSILNKDKVFCQQKSATRPFHTFTARPPPNFISEMQK
jgi:hypothetical protein